MCRDNTCARDKINALGVLLGTCSEQLVQGVRPWAWTMVQGVHYGPPKGVSTLMDPVSLVWRVREPSMMDPVLDDFV